MLDIASLLDRNMGEIADLPSYEVPPNGLYRLLILKKEQKKVDLEDAKDVPTLQFDYKVLEAVKLVDDTKLELVKKDQEFSQSYFFNKEPETTLKAVKTAFKFLGEELGETNLMVLLEKVTGLEVFATVTQRAPKGKDRVYANVDNIHLTTAPQSA